MIRIPVKDFAYKLVKMCTKSFVASGCMWLAESRIRELYRQNEVLDRLGTCGQHSVAYTCHFSRLFYILCTLVVLHRTRLHVCTMSLLLTCHMHMQYVCSVIRLPRLSGYFGGKQMCAVMRGLTVLTSTNYPHLHWENICHIQ